MSCALNSSYKLSGIPSGIANAAQRQQQYAAERGANPTGNYRVINTFDDISYAENATYSSTKTATMELVEDVSTGSAAWRVVVKLGFNIGDAFANIPIKQVRQGTNGRVFVVGRDMSNVAQFADDLAAKIGAQNVEIFADGITECRFTYEGKYYSSRNFASLTDDLRNGAYSRYLTGEQKGWVIYEEVLNTKLGKLNEAVIKEKMQQGYTILDIGNPNNNLIKSGFYDMEILNTFKK